MTDKNDNQWLKEETVEVSSRSWFGFKSEMDKTIQKYEKDGWTLINKEQVESKKRYNLHFGFKEKTILEKAHRYRFFLYPIGIMIIIFACSYFAVWSSYQELQRTYYVTSNSINIRENPNINSEVVGSLRFRDSVEVLDTVEGSIVSGSNEWFEIKVGGERAYVHSSLFSNSRPPIPPTRIPIVATSEPSQPQFNQPQSSQPQSSQWNCSGDRYNCSSFSSCSAMFSYWNTCPGDPSGLDGNDNDGRPCESRCG